MARASENPSRTMLVRAARLMGDSAHAPRKGAMSCTTVNTMCTSEPKRRKPRKEKHASKQPYRIATP
eukprot:4029445-Prymnesium_polylepis.2